MMAPRAATSFLSLESATFRLGDRLVFPNTSWMFRRGEQWAVLGPNGSGKSLFADCLRGQLPLVGGTLRYEFRSPAGLSPEEVIGHVAFEERRLEVHGAVVQSRWNSIEEEGALLVREHLSYERVMDINPFEIRGDDREARAAFARRLGRAARLLGIEPFRDRTLLSLSNGERQRVELARALCRPLRLLILDEPFSGLDRATREHFGPMLERLMSTPLRVLFISARAEDLPHAVSHVLHVRDCRVLHGGPRERTTRRAGSGLARILPLGPSAKGNKGLLSPALSSRRGEEGGRRERRRSRREVLVPGITSPARSTPKGESTRKEASTYLCGKHAGPFLLATSGRATDSSRGGARVLVRLQSVTVRYGAKVILDRFNWEIRQGESWALLGPNGSGKSTILSLIMGDHPQAYMNDVAVFGKLRGEGESIWEIKRQIGTVSPELQTHFSQEATCFEVAASGFFDSNGLFERPALRQRRAARAWLRRFGLLRFADQPLYGMSAGLQRMALLARALVKRPQLLLLDEPCQGLDREHRRLFLNTVDGLIRRGFATVVYVTHREEEIPRAIRRALRLA